MKIQYHLIALTIFVSSCASQRGETSIDLERLTERISICSHLASETGSGDPGREGEVTDSMRAMDCDEDNIRQDISTARAMYAEQPEKLTALEAAIRVVASEHGIKY